MKKGYLKIALSILFLANFTLCTFAATKTKVITPSSPVASESLKPIIADYRDGNYIQSMLKLEELVAKEPDNTYANYYLALTYTRLGKKEEAQNYYNKVISLDSNMSLRYYSQKALACLESPTDQSCTEIKSTSQIARGTQDDTLENSEDDDITKFIKSGRQIHPAAADSITRERMERKLQADEYLRKQQESSIEKQSALLPTKDEMLTLIKVSTQEA